MGQKQKKGAEKREKQAKQKARAQAVEVAKQKHHLSRKKWATRTIKEMVFVLCIAAVAVRTLRKFYARYAPLVRPAGAADLPLIAARADVFGPAVAHSLRSCAETATRNQARVVALFSDEAAFRNHAATACFAPVLKAARLPESNAFRLHVLRSDATSAWHFDEAATTRMDTRYAALATSAYYVDAGGGDVEVARFDEAWSRQHASDKPAALEALAALSAEAEGPGAWEVDGALRRRAAVMRRDGVATAAELGRATPAANGLLTFPTAFHRTLPPAAGPADEDGFSEPPPRLVVVLEQYALPAHALKWAPPFELATTVRGARALAKPPVATSY